MHSGFNWLKAGACVKICNEYDDALLFMKAGNYIKYYRIEERICKRELFTNPETKQHIHTSIYIYIYITNTILFIF
jgi:hypothetical protein